ncbi:MAG: hypothetical protein BroJett025_02710 [Patescibacteria group bacterium]|nr:MAG: hypothetical protein BroJett025_02710 [Patescibacteria group bacterium]
MAKTMIINLNKAFEEAMRVDLAIRNQQQPKLELPKRQLKTSAEIYKPVKQERFLK